MILDTEPRADRLEVEDAMAVSLTTVYTVVSGFRPKLPQMRIAPVSSIFVLVLVCAIPGVARAAETQRASTPNTVSSDGADQRPLIIQNPDGTMTMQKEPASGKSGGAGQKGLVIPPQVVVPTVRAPADYEKSAR